MKSFLATVILVIAMVVTIMAQPTTITWQGKLLDASGNAINQNNVAMTFAMFDAETDGNQLWPASGVVAKVVNIVNGLYSLQLGTGVGDDIAFTAAMFDGKTPWLEVKVGTETLPRTEITTVPFALISNDLSAAGWENPGEIGKTTPNTGKFTSIETGSLKITTGASDGKVLTSDAEGNTSWETPYTGLTNFTESNFTYDTKTGVKFTPNNAAANVDVVLQPKGEGGILAQQSDGTATGGNNRGKYAVDLQTTRTLNTEVASGYASVITGGERNTASGGYSWVGGGLLNTANGGRSAVVNGLGNIANGQLAFVGNGDQNIATTTSAFVGNGSSNMASGSHSFVGNGSANTASGDFSFVSSGISNTAPSYGETVLGYYTTTYTPGTNGATLPNATDRLFAVGNGTSATRSNALTILKNANTTIGGSLSINGNGTNTSYLFPATRGTSGQVLKTDGNGGTNWATPYTGLTYFTESGYTFNGKSGVRFLATSGQQNADIVLQPTGEGGILAQQPDGTASFGNNRGKYAVDLQLKRTYNTEVASGDYATVGGGLSNTASGTISTVAGGYTNTANGYVSTIGGGLRNISSGEYAAVGGGFYNTAGGNYSYIGSGQQNVAPSYGETVLGYLNTIYTPGTDGATQPNPTDRLFTIGNGDASGRSDAFIMLKNANTTIGGTLEINKNGTSTSYTFPATRGTIGQVLTTNGGGSLSWTSPTTGTVTAVSGAAPISVATGTTTPAISISPATTLAAGSMSATDKSKLDGIAANANNYIHPTGDGDLHVPATGTTNNGKVLTAGATAGSFSWVTPTFGTVTSVTGTAPITVATGTTTPAISISPATSSTAGSMSAADKTRLDGLVSSQWTTSGSNIYYNSGNVGIGTSAPKAPLEFNNVAANRKIVFYTTSDNDHQFTGFGLNNDALRFQLANTSGNFKFYGATSESASTELFRIQGNGQIVFPALTTKGVLLNSTTGVISSSAGTSGQVLTTDGSGNISWQNATIHEAADQFSATASQTSFTLSQTPSANSKVKLFINGIRIGNTAYTVSGTTLTYIPENNGNYPLTAGDRIQMDYFYE